MSESQTSESFLVRFFRTKTDFYGLLTEQADTTYQGVAALKKWIEEGSSDRCQLVRDLEHQADSQKMVIAEKLTDTLVTPIDREDIYDLSHRLDHVINGAKTTVREIEAFKLCTADVNLIRMAEVLEIGAKNLYESTRSLNGKLDQSLEHAHQARKCEREMELAYRDSVSELMESDDLKHIFRCREIYRTMLNTAQSIEGVGETLLHILIKIR